MLEFIEKNLIWLIIALIVVVVIILVLVVRRRPKKVRVIVDTFYMAQVLEALGGKANISQTEIEHKRVRVFVHNTKLLNPAIFKTLNIPVFIKAKEVKLLLKEEPNLVKQFLDQKGENK